MNFTKNLKLQFRWNSVSKSALALLLMACGHLVGAQTNFTAFWNASVGKFPDQIDPAWTVFHTNNFGAPVFTNAGLFLSTTSIGSEYGYDQMGTNLVNALEIEAVLKVDSSTTIDNSRAGTFITFTTSPGVGNALYVSTNIIFLITNGLGGTGDFRGAFTNVDTQAAFHDYRIQVSGTAAGSAVSVFYDGGAAPVITGSTFAHSSDFTLSPSRIIWGEGSIYAYGSAEWRSIKDNAYTGGLNFSKTTVAGTNLAASGGGGTANGDFLLLTATNISLPPTNWTALATNAFDANGDFTITNLINLLERQRFFVLKAL